MSKKPYKIGQVLYIISPQTQTIIPVQIQEINQKTTIDGEETAFMINDPENRGPFNLEEINGEVFTQSSDASKYLKDNATKAIDAMVDGAVSLAKSKFGNTGGAANIFPPPAKPSKTTKANKNNKSIEETEEDFSMVEVVDKKGKTKVQKQKVRFHMPNGEVVKN